MSECMKVEFMLAENVFVFIFYGFGQFLYRRPLEEREHKLVFFTKTIRFPGFIVGLEFMPRKFLLIQPGLKIRLFSPFF